jgi:molecular chaperone GrpE
VTPHPDTPVEPVEPDEVVEASFGVGLGEVDVAEADEHGTLHAVVPIDEHQTVVRERDEYLDSLQRLKAEFDNYRRRVDRDRELQHTSGVRDLVAELLPVIDNLERAIVALGGAGDQIVAGVEMVRGQLASLLSGRGVQEIDAHSTAFDPNVHEAVAQHPTDEHDEGTVVHVAEKGYRLGETVLRPAKVVVAARLPESDEA